MLAIADEGKGVEVAGLELFDYRLVSLGVLGHRAGLAEVIRAVAELLRHVPVGMGFVSYLLRDFPGPLEIPRARPVKLFPCHSTDSCVQITGLAGVEIPPCGLWTMRLVEDIPYARTDISRVSLFKIDVNEDVSWVWHHRPAELVLHILQIGSGSKYAEARRHSSSVRSGDVEAGSNTTVVVNFSLKEGDLFSEISEFKNVTRKDLRVEV